MGAFVAFVVGVALLTAEMALSGRWRWFWYSVIV